MKQFPDIKEIKLLEKNSQKKKEIDKKLKIKLNDLFVKNKVLTT